MKKVYSLLTGMILSGAVIGQCTTWVNPSATTGWSDFTSTFDGAPCDDGSGCPVNEINGFEIWADEAYQMNNVNAGGTYTFSACNGVGGTAWNILFTIVAPSGAVDAFGLDNGSVCALTFTATETGNYLVVVSEAGACGTSSNQGTNNGFPSMTCVSSPETQCGAIGIEEVAGDNGIVVAPNPSTGIFNVMVDGVLETLEVMDVNGRLLSGVSGIRSGNGGNHVIDLSTYADGSYLVRATVNGHRVVERITLAR